MNYLFGLISIVSFFVLLSVKVDENQKMRSISHLIVRLILWNSIVVIASLAIYVFFIGDSGAGSGYASIEKKINITIKDGSPCFYVDSFEGINDYHIDYFNIVETRPPSEWMNKKLMWGYGKDSNNSLQLSSFIGIDQCVPYAPSKKLQINVLYSVTMEGTKKNIPQKELKNGDSIWLYRAFYLIKNQKTGEIEVVMPNQTEVDIRIKKMVDQNKLNQITKEKK